MSGNGTEGEAYTTRLETRSQVWWKRWVDVQAPYRWNLARQKLGVTLDVGCGIGRNLASLPAGSVGVDHNAASVQVARRRGLCAMTVEEWTSVSADYLERFDGLLVAHVIEHLEAVAGTQLLREYLPYLRPGGKVFFVCPQERGYASDHTHLTWTTGEDLEVLANRCGLIPEAWKSFPLPRVLGRWFTYNEFTLVATKPEGRSG